jgi:epoxyqueuosine reductase
MAKFKMLLHHCCAPCSVKPVEHFMNKYNIESFWYNPNIQPEEEYEQRKESFEKYATSFGFNIHQGSQHLQQLWQQKPEGRKIERCKWCYYIRLMALAQKANKLGIKYFSTTLLSSPFQFHQIIKETGERIAHNEGLIFVYEDFRVHYHSGKEKLRDEGYYIQKYCGCMPSLIERQKEKLKRI